jgi:hypothetical protein
VFEKSPKKVKGDFDNNRFRPEADALPKQGISGGLTQHLILFIVKHLHSRLLEKCVLDIRKRIVCTRIAVIGTAETIEAVEIPWSTL